MCGPLLGLAVFALFWDHMLPVTCHVVADTLFVEMLVDIPCDENEDTW